MPRRPPTRLSSAVVDNEAEALTSDGCGRTVMSTRHREQAAYEINRGKFEGMADDDVCEVLCCHHALPLAAQGIPALDAVYRGTARAYRSTFRDVVSNPRRLTEWLSHNPALQGEPPLAFARRCLAEDLLELRRAHSELRRAAEELDRALAENGSAGFAHTYARLASHGVLDPSTL
jgi:hypothetical protein